MRLYSKVFVFLLFCGSLIAQQSKDVSIDFKSTNFSYDTYYLASYYGKYTVLIDSTKTSTTGVISFKRDKAFTPGIYMLVDAKKSMLTEFIMGDEQQFTIDLTGVNPKVTNSEINAAFFEFNKLLKTTGETNKKRIDQLASATSKGDSLVIEQQLIDSQKAITLFKKSYIKNHPSDVLSLSFLLSKPIDGYIYDISEQDQLSTKNDTLLFVKNQFLKGIDFNDERLLRTPFLEKKLETYFNTFVPKNAETISEEIQLILDSIDDRNSNMFSYLSFYFLNQYFNPTIMGLDRVYVNLYNRYFKDVSYDWLRTEQQLSLKFSYESLKDNLIGEKARNLFMTSLEGKQRNLYDIEAPFIVLIFWDPTCGHCKTELPRIKKIYDEQLKSDGVTIYAVNINPDLELQWKTFIEKEKLQDWIHVRPSSTVYGNYTKEDVDFQTLYNVTQTPVMYLLDKNKIFRAKKIEVDKYPLIIDQLKSLGK